MGPPVHLISGRLRSSFLLISLLSPAVHSSARSSMASGVVASDGKYSALPSGVYFGLCHCDRQHSRGFSLGRTCPRLRWSILLPRGSCRLAERPADCLTGNLQDARVHGVDVIVYCWPPQRSVRTEFSMFTNYINSRSDESLRGIVRLCMGLGVCVLNECGSHGYCAYYNGEGACVWVGATECMQHRLFWTTEYFTSCHVFTLVAVL